MQKNKRKSTLAEQELSTEIKGKKFNLKVLEIETPIGKSTSEDLYIEVAGSKSRTGEINLICKTKKELPQKFCEAVGFVKIKRHGKSFFSANYYILSPEIYPLGNRKERMESLIHRINTFGKPDSVNPKKDPREMASN